MMRTEGGDLILAPRAKAITLPRHAGLDLLRRILSVHPDRDGEAYQRTQRLDPISPRVWSFAREERDHMLAPKLGDGLLAVLLAKALQNRPACAPRLLGDLVLELNRIAIGLHECRDRPRFVAVDANILARRARSQRRLICRHELFAAGQSGQSQARTARSTEVVVPPAVSDETLHEGEQRLSSLRHCSTHHPTGCGPSPD